MSEPTSRRSPSPLLPNEDSALLPAATSENSAPRNWMVWDATKPDPWGINTGDFGPMTQAEAEAMVERGRAEAVPRRYMAGPAR